MTSQVQDKELRKQFLMPSYPWRSYQGERDLVLRLVRVMFTETSKQHLVESV